MTSASSIHEAGHSKPVLWDNPEGWGGEGVGGCSGWGTYLHPWVILINVWQKPPQDCNYPPIKINKLKKKQRYTVCIEAL